MLVSKSLQSEELYQALLGLYEVENGHPFWAQCSWILHHDVFGPSLGKNEVNCVRDSDKQAQRSLDSRSTIILRACAESTVLSN